ncbi:hypothetical protein BDR03DRAFT_954745 [Suillus americanus]|nr:hypothetical protein BDR03DRAFT_954745 [Suillus americanus]
MTFKASRPHRHPQPLLFFSPELHSQSPYLPSSSAPHSTHRSAHPRSSFWEGQYIRLELIRVNDLPLPSRRIPAGIFVTINGDWKRRWKSAVRVPSSDDSEMLGDIVIL